MTFDPDKMREMFLNPDSEDQEEETPEKMKLPDEADRGKELQPSEPVAKEPEQSPEEKSEDIWKLPEKPADPVQPEPVDEPLAGTGAPESAESPFVDKPHDDVWGDIDRLARSREPEEPEKIVPDRQPDEVGISDQPVSHEPVMGSEPDPEPAMPPEKPVSQIPEPESEPKQEPEIEVESVKKDPGDFMAMREALVQAGEEEVKETEPEPEVHEAVKVEKDGKRKKKKYDPEKPPASPSPLTGLMLILGLISFAGGAIAFAIGKTGTPIYASIGIGLLFIVLFMLINSRWISYSLSARSVKYSTNVIIVLLSLFGILVIGNLISFQYHYRIDLTSEGLRSLSPQTLQVLDNINRAGEEITVMVFTPPESEFQEGLGAIRREVEDLMDLYLYQTELIKLSFIDPEVERTLTEQKGISRYPSIYFEMGENKSIINDLDEPHITSALLAVQGQLTRKVYFLTGHGEPNPFSDSELDMSRFREQLELEGYEADRLNLASENGVPEDASLLIIAGPDNTYDPREVRLLSEYLEGGGNLLALLEPERETGLESLLGDFGIELNDGVLLDASNNYFDEPDSPVVVGNPAHPITDSLPEMDALMLVGAGTLTTTRLENIEIENLVNSNSASWIEKTDDLEYTDGTEQKASYVVGALSVKALGPAPSEPDEESQPVEAEGADGTSDVSLEASGEGVPLIAQVLAVADGSFAQNGNIENYNNLDFAMNAVNFLASRQDLISIRRTPGEDRTLELSKVQKGFIFAVSVILTPLLIALFGGLVWWKRS